MSDVERWGSVEDALKQLGVIHTERIKRTRDKFTQASSTGAFLMPDFTLHNVTHSDNIIMLLATLQKTFNFSLSIHEAELLTTAAYLHDLGMFFSKTRWEDKILPDFSTQLRFCPVGSCDNPTVQNLRGKDISVQIRLSHNLLSAWWLLNSSPDAFDFDADDRGYLITLCRGHRATDLTTNVCNCYQTKAVEGQALRIGILSSLLRLSDALDLYNNRTPKLVFEQRALDFLSNPLALEHWIKHYFVSDPYLKKDSRAYKQLLICSLYFTVPMKFINGVSYSDFFYPLFEKHVNAMRISDLNANNYPSDFLSFLGISGMDAILMNDVIPGFRELPQEIISTIEESNCTNILTFLDWLPHLSSTFSVVRENIQLLLGLSHEIVAPLSGVQASCEQLVHSYDTWSRDRILQQIENIQLQAIWAARIAHNYAFMLSSSAKVTFTLHSADPKILINNCVNLFKVIAMKRQIHLVIDLDSISSIPQVRVDTALFTQALSNLLDNAIKYSVKGTEVTVQSKSDSNMLQIYISNFGIPISKEEVEKIFKRGFRSSAAIASSPSGSGLGLPVAREIIMMHGGEVIALPSEYVKDINAYKTTLILRLPLNIDKQKEEELK